MLKEILSRTELIERLNAPEHPRCYPPGSDRARWARLLDSPVRRAWAEEYLRAARQLKDRRGGEPLYPPEYGKVLTSAVTLDEVRQTLQSYSYSVCYAVTAQPGTQGKGGSEDVE